MLIKRHVQDLDDSTISDSPKQGIMQTAISSVINKSWYILIMEINKVMRKINLQLDLMIWMNLTNLILAQDPDMIGYLK